MRASRNFSLLTYSMLTFVMACSSTNKGPDRGNVVAGNNSSGGATSGSGGMPVAGFNFAGGAIVSGGAVATGGASGTGGTSDPNVCGGKTVEPQTIEVMVDVEVTRASPVAIYIMLDQSASMIPLWQGATQAITDFVNDPASAGLDVALGLFPPTALVDGCAASSYNPPAVPMGRLPGYAQTIADGLSAAGPFGIATPTEGALRGTTEFCKNFTPADPADAGEKCVVLFITDGAPNGCAEDTPSLVGVAQGAGVPIYTVALNGVPDLTLLNMIADATGTDCDPGSSDSTCDLTSGASFIDALTLIRDTIVTVETHTETMVQPLTCEWGLPDPDPGQDFDKDKVNVVLSSPTGDVSFAKSADKASCGNSDSAWYYDDETNPTRVLACPKTCDVIEAAQNSSVNIQLGCPTVILM